MDAGILKLIFWFKYWYLLVNVSKGIYKKIFR